ncbi:LADA_0E12354g1_1 [Lachancea dasiensis]|uniref:LADA_0E12354g1_1 n=1 Tax=Lachancea dasiensis TaxID=1072105 RepID=A0A1G4JF54_9SACH|nr:LADA_0E12354g1_1 [Lachancea dasiensis]
MNAAFTCNACLIQFRSSDQQRYHMKTEWHRYNLKRKIAQLAPISADLFAEKVQISEKEKELNQVDEFGFPLLKSRERRSSNANPKAKPKKKRGRPLEDLQKSERDEFRSTSPAMSIASDISKFSLQSTDFDDEKSYDHGFTTDSNYDYYTSDYDSEKSEDDDPSNDRELFKSNCIFCGAENKEVERNVNHMFRAHGLYIPERSYLTNLEGLLRYLVDSIVVAKRCLCCSFQGSSLESIRAHIASKGHGKLPYETKDDRFKISDFYDFSSLEHNDLESSQSSDSSTTQNAEPPHAPGVEVIDENVVQGINSNFTQAEIDDSGVELSLPTGVRAGHRSMRRYYRQNLPLPPDASDGNRTVALGDRRFLGGVTEKMLKKNDKKAQQVERQHINRKIRSETRRGNFQTHFRDELLQ